MEALEVRELLARVVTIGDSWAGFIANGAPGSIADSGTGNSLQTMLNFGIGQGAIPGGTTVYNGSYYGGTAGQHAADLAGIGARIAAAGPDADIVYLSTGGNDMLLGALGGGFTIQMSPEQQNALFNTIRGNVQTIVNYILGIRPDIQIVIASYDYINVWDTTNENAAIIRANLGMVKSGNVFLDGPQNVLLNAGLRGMEQGKQDIAAASSRVAHVYNYGFNQIVSGYSGYFGNWPAGLVYNDLPYDDQYIGASRNDMIHMTTSGYNNIALNAYTSFFDTAFLPASLTTSGTLLDFGYVRIGGSANQSVTASNNGPDFTKVKNLSSQAASGSFSGGGLSYNPLFKDPTLGSDTAQIAYSFTPTSHGFVTQTRSLTSDSGSRNLVLSGWGVGPIFGGWTSINMGSQPPNYSPSATFSFGNVSGDPNLGALTNLTISSASITGPNANLFQLSGFTPGAVFAPGASQTAQMTFLGAAAPGVYTANLTFQTDVGAAFGGAGQSYTIPISVTVAPFAFTGGPYAAAEGTSVFLTGSGGGLGAVYEWDLDNNGSYETAGQFVSYAATDNGARVVGLRVTNGTQAFGSATINVSNVAPTAAINGPTSGVRGAPMSFSLSATDASPIDQAAAFTYDVDWNNDGVYDQTVVGSGAGAVVNHVFTAAGAHTVGVRATDKDGGTGAKSTLNVSIANYLVSGGSLYVGGSTGDDFYSFWGIPGPSAIGIITSDLGILEVYGVTTGQIHLYMQAGADTVTINAGVSGKTFTVDAGEGFNIMAPLLGSGNTVNYTGGSGVDQFFLVAGPNNVVTLNGGDGDDVFLDVSGDPSNQVTVNGGDGNDGAAAGPGPAHLHGGDGNDMMVSFGGGATITGGNGDDFLVGGAGAAQIDGGADSDLIVAGSLVFLPNATDGFVPIWQEWGFSGNSFATRKGNIETGATTGGYTITDGSTALDNGVVDTILGGTEEDWLVYKFDQDIAADYSIGTDVRTNLT